MQEAPLNLSAGGSNLLTTPMSSDRFQCEICKKNYKTKASLKQHHYRFHGQGAKFNCNVCAKEFVYASFLREHMIKHSKGQYKCEVCGNTFKSQKGLKWHNYRQHPKNPKFQCKVCDKTFVFESTLKLHMASHSPDGPFKCEACSKKFPYEFLLKHHSLVHKSPQFSCELCPKKFKSLSGFNRHNRIVH